MRVSTIIGAGIYVLIGEVAGKASMYAPFAFQLAAIVPDGGWIVQLAATNDERAANILARCLWQAGYGASIKRVDSGDRTYYRLHVDRFDSELEARGFASRIKGQFSVTSAWVTHSTVESRPHQ